jgi:hypothetical protein
MLRGDQPERVIAGAAKICWHTDGERRYPFMAGLVAALPAVPGGAEGQQRMHPTAVIAMEKGGEIRIEKLARRSVRPTAPTIEMGLFQRP